MTGVLTPAQALAYLSELSPAVTAARMLDRAGATLASHGPSAALEAANVIRVRDNERELIVAIGARAVVELARADAASALAAVRLRC